MLPCCLLQDSMEEEAEQIWKIVDPVLGKMVAMPHKILDWVLDLISSQVNYNFPRWYLKMSRNFPTNPIKKNVPACYLHSSSLLTNFIFFYRANNGKS